MHVWVKYWSDQSTEAKAVGVSVDQTEDGKKLDSDALWTAWSVSFNKGNELNSARKRRMNTTKTRVAHDNSYLEYA